MSQSTEEFVADWARDNGYEISIQHIIKQMKSRKILENLVSEYLFTG